MKILPLLLVFVALHLIVVGQNVGINSSTPQTRLEVNGAISSTPSTVLAGNSIAIPANVSIVRISDDGTSASNSISVASPKEGQYLTIYNADANTATFSGNNITGGTGVATFVYIGSGWRLIANNSIAAAGTGGYVILLGHSNTSLVASNTYVAGASFDLPAITLFNDRPSRRGQVPAAGQIKSVQVNSYVTGTLAGATNDSYTMRIKNITQNTTQDFVTNFGLSSGNLSSQSRIDNYTLPTPMNVNAGDVIQVQILTPAWTTAPTGVYQKFNVYIE
jgi:hypothetical protein